MSIPNKVDKEILNSVIKNRKELPDNISSSYTGYEFEASPYKALTEITNNDIAQKTRQELYAMNSYLIGKLGTKLKSTKPTFSIEEQKQVIVEISTLYVDALKNTTDAKRKLLILDHLLNI